MTNWIEHVSEPDRLLLAWQAPDVVGDRQRWAVGELARTADGARLRYFRDGEFERYNFGQPFSKIDGYGYRGYPAFPLKQDEHDGAVLEAFMRRLPPRGRADFERYREHLRLRPDTEISDFALLGLSEAYLPSDGFSIVDPLKPDVGECELLTELAGYRYYLKDHPEPELGREVELVPEPENPHDANAIFARLDGAKLGFINRLQAPTVLAWIRQGRVRASVDRMNGRPERPRVFLFLTVSPR